MKKIDSLAPWPHFDETQINIASGILASGRVNYWTGEEGRAFEQAFAEYHQAPHAIALANGTLALELALIALGIGPGDEVIVTPRSYFASVSAVLIVGATPRFADVDPDSQNITAATIAEQLTDRTRAIIPVHLAGWPCDMPAIVALANKHDLLVIEDCAQAHGATIDGQPVGSFGDAGAFSFCQDKIMTTAGEGGMVTLADEVVWKRAWEYKDHGKSYDAVFHRDHPIGFRWLHESVGSNWRLTELQSAIGRWQLTQLDQWVDTRRYNADRFADAFGGFPVVRIPRPADGVRHAFYKFYMFIVPDRLRHGWTRDKILKGFADFGVPGLSGSCPEIYKEKALRSESVGSLPIAQKLGETSIMLPVHPTLTSRNIDQIIEGVSQILKAASV